MEVIIVRESAKKKGVLDSWWVWVKGEFVKKWEKTFKN